MLDSTENFVEYGTPLEPLQEDDVPSKKPVSVQDQIAVDEQGRRRFHGAFTGGFSAGYYNTVGSKEGWTPSEFKSSRQNRAESATNRKGQNVQDFMDEEDLGAFGIAPQVLRATTDFEQREDRKRARPAPESGPIPGIPVLEQIIQPVKNTIGIRILQRMGWRLGQGIGPRLTKAERMHDRERREKKRLKEKRKDEASDELPVDEKSAIVDHKVYGCYMPPEFRKIQDDSDSGSDESAVDISLVTFAPDDFDDALCNPKENTFGLGYTGLDRSALTFGPIDLFGTDAGIKSRVENRKLNIRGEAFGIGAFEDADEEVYNRNDMAQYDFSLETPGERKERRGVERLAKKGKNATTESGVLNGFVRAKNPVPPRKYFPAPPLPKNFEPKHYIRRSRFDEPPPVIADDSSKKKLGLERHRLTIQERQVLLGEEKLPLTPQEQLALEEKVKEEKEKVKRDQAIEKTERLKKFTEILQTYSSNKGSRQGVSGAFKPFMKNPEKQERYEKYMTLIGAGFSECLKDLQPLDMTEWERERERMEFERASALYRPMGNVIASRFVSAQSHDISHLVPVKEVELEKDPTQDPKIAAKMGLFGKLTHKAYEWHPDRLLCKRFNVPHPYPESKTVGVVRRDTARSVPVSLANSSTNSGENSADIAAQTSSSVGVSTPAVKKSLFDNLDFSKPPPGLLPLQPPTAIISSEEDICPPGTEHEPSENKFKQPEVEKQSSQTPASHPPVTKPPIDLFKEIFENSSSESEEEEPQKRPTPSQSSPATLSRFEKAERKSDRESRSHTERPKEEWRNNRDVDKKYSDDHGPPKAKGIFDNLDFSKLDAQREKAEVTIGVKSNKDVGNERKSVATNERKSDAEEEVDLYGPLPPRHFISISSTVSRDIQSTKQEPRGDLSKGSRGNPINSASNLENSDEVMWVEVSKGKRRQDRSSSKERESSSSKAHKQKKLKKTHKRRASSSAKSKKSKKRRDSKSKSKKSKKHKRDTSSETSGNEVETETDSDSDDSTIKKIKIHQSFNNKALLSKLKELTRSK